MISAEFQPSLLNSAPAAYTEHPYVLAEIWARDPSNIYRFMCSEWDRSDSQIFERKYLGATLVGLEGHRTSLTKATLTTTRTINKEGLYWVLIRCTKFPTTEGAKTVALSIDDKEIGRISTQSAEGEYYKFLDFGYVQLTSGSHDFEIELDGLNTWVDHLLMYRLDYYSSESSTSKYSLDWKSIEFTENSMGELNSCEMVLPLREQWNDPNLNIYSRKVFEFGDIFNITVGSSTNWGDAKVKFGGYVLGVDENDEGTELTINGIDRMVDLYRKPVYANYAIGVAPSGGDNCTFPVIQFGSGLEAIRHISETCEYGPLNYGIIYPYTLNLNFKNPSDYGQVVASGFTKTYSPGSGLRLGYDKLNVDACGVTPETECVLTLWDSPDNPFDAAIDETLCLKYMASGESCGTPTRVQFNIEVTMYRAGESVANEQTYTILFTGKAGASNIIDQGTPVLNGIEQLLKLNLKSAFDKYAPSTEYNVTKIELVDVVTSTQIAKRQNSTIQIIGLTAYDSDVNTKMELTQETSYPYENVTSILEEMKYVGWVDYGRRRATDILMIAPEMNEAASVEAVDGVNVLSVTDKSYAPYDTIRNRQLLHYHYKEGDTDKTGVAMVENSDSVARYGPGAWESYEDKTEINNQVDADKEASRFVQENSYALTSFTLVIRGTSLLNPSQYIVSKLMKDYLVGNYSTKTATHTIDEKGYITKVSVNRPGSYYEEIMGKLEKKMKDAGIVNSRSMYSQTALNNMGFISIGAFERSGM